MTMGFGALAAAAPFVAAWVALSQTLRDAPLLRAAVAAGLSLGVTSIAWFLFRIAGLPIRAYVIVELLGVVAVLMRHRRGINRTRIDPRDHRRWTTADIAFAVYIAAAIAAASLVFARTMMAHPHGSSDAWAMWTLKAAFLALPSAAWRDGFAAGTELPHVDYPLLLPGAIARVAWFTADLARSARLIAIATLAGIVLAVAGAVRQWSGGMMASAAVALLLAPEFVTQTAMLNADLLVGFYAVLAVALLQWSGDAARVSERDGSVGRGPSAVLPATSKTTILAGFFAGCAAWTKNEGLIVAGAVVVYLAWRWLRGRERTATLTDLLIGLWPMLVLVIAFKLWTPANDLVDGVLAPGAWRRWLDTFRVAFVWREMWRGLWMWGEWWIAPPVLLLVLASVVSRVAVTFEARARLPRPALGLVLLALQLTAFFVVYVMTPHSVAWHVGTSWPRLIAQMWPVMVWTACAASFPRSAPISGRI